MVDRDDSSMDFSVPRHAVGVPGKIEKAADICKNSADLNTHGPVVNRLFGHSPLGSGAAGHRDA